MRNIDKQLENSWVSSVNGRPINGNEHDPKLWMTWYTLERELLFCCIPNGGFFTITGATYLVGYHYKLDLLIQE